MSLVFYISQLTCRNFQCELYPVLVLFISQLVGFHREQFFLIFQHCLLVQVFSLLEPQWHHAQAFFFLMLIWVLGQPYGPTTLCSHVLAPFSNALFIKRTVKIRESIHYRLFVWQTFSANNKKI